MGSTDRCARCGRELNDTQHGVCPDCQMLDPATGARSPSDASTVARPASPAPPSPFEHYRVLSTLGEGGMGVVYLAEQDTPRRRVALKVIKTGMATSEVVARFEVERQALAMMDHPNIATVYDAGATVDGRPFFAMEYVAGVPITDYCDRHQLSTRDRLTLFLEVCAAVQHAHQKGIIHRDLKPSNVLVGVVDGVAVPKVIDFGVAKAIRQRLTEKTLFTQLGLLIGTPEYMSPEQAEMTGLDVDTTTDIYALGVLLYQLLVGALPFDSERLRRAGYGEIQRIIREEEPQRPSTRLTELGAGGDAIARHRRTDRTSLARQIRGDLDWITLKALEKDRTRRYPSASEFAADVRRHLADEPIVARPSGVISRTRKFVSRHRWGVAAALLAVGALSAFSVATARQSARLAVERDRAEAVSRFLISLFEASGPDRARGEDVTARQLLDRGRERLDTELKDAPQSRAALLEAIGTVYAQLDAKDAAEATLGAAVQIRRTGADRDPAALATSVNELANLYMAKGDIDRAAALHGEVLELRRTAYGQEHPKVVQTLANLANVAFYRGRFDEAERQYRALLEMAQRVSPPTDVAAMRVGLASALINQNRVVEAIDLLQPAVTVLTDTLGAEHTRTLAATSNLSGALTRAGRYADAETLQRRLLEARRRILGPQHFDVAVTLYNLANALLSQGRFDDALRAFEEARVIHESVDRGPHMEYAWVLADLALAQRRLGRFDAAERSYRASIDVFERATNDAPTAVAFAWDGLGEVWFARGRVADAERAFRHALGVRRSAAEPPGHGLAESSELLAQAVCEQGPSDEGERLAREAVAIRERAAPPDAEQQAFAQAVLGRCLAARRAFGAAEPLLREAHAALAKSPARAGEAAYAARTLSALYEAAGQPAEAASWRARVASTPIAGRLGSITP